MAEPLRAITLWPEWVWAITVLGKPVENRSWWHNLPAGTKIALHAGKHIGGHPGATAKMMGLRRVQGQSWEAGWSSGTSFMNERLDGLDEYRFERGAERHLVQVAHIPTSAIVAIVTLGAREDRPIVRGTPTGWAVPGDVHWWFDEVQVLPTPVPCAGRQGLWTVPPHIAAEVPDVQR